MITLILAVIALIVVLSAILLKLYVKTPANMAFIRTGLGGKKVVIDRGAIVLPIIQSIQWLSLETFKLEVLKANREAFITKDRFRVDIGAEFYMKIEADAGSIERASRSLGAKSFSAEGIRALLEEKLISSLRSVVAKMALVELHENRRGFAQAVMENLKEVLIPNGLTLEDVSIFHLDQTPKDQLDPSNIFDAEGLKQITAQTSASQRERNEIERNTEVAIRRKDVEAVKLKLALDQEREFAEAEQIYNVETNRAQRRAEAEQFKFKQEQMVREAEIFRDQAIREAEIKRETYLIERNLERERAEIERHRVIEEEKKEKEIGIIRREVERLEAEKARLEMEAARERMSQEVISVNKRAEAERAKEIALIEALKELEVADQKARAVERVALSKVKDGEAEAYTRYKMQEAENVTDAKLIWRDIIQELIKYAPAMIGGFRSQTKT